MSTVYVERLVPGTELLDVQRAAYLVEAALIGSDGIPALRDSVESLRATGLTWYGCRDADGLLGAVAHPGDLSRAVLRDIEKKPAHLFGPKWT